MSWATFLIGLVGPLTARVLASLGLSLVSMAGLTAALVTLKGMVHDNLASLPADTLQLGGLFGLWYCIGIWLGAVTFCVTWASTKGVWTLGKK